MRGRWQIEAEIETSFQLPSRKRIVPAPGVFMAHAVIFKPTPQTWNAPPAPRVFPQNPGIFRRCPGLFHRNPRTFPRIPSAFPRCPGLFPRCAACSPEIPFISPVVPAFPRKSHGFPPDSQPVPPESPRLQEIPKAFHLSHLRRFNHFAACKIINKGKNT
jgi:hypothetical protein